MLGHVTLLLVGLLACGTDDRDAVVEAPPPSAPVPTPEAEPAPEPPPVTGHRARVLLVILGEFPEELAAAVEEGLREELDVAVERVGGVRAEGAGGPRITTIDGAPLPRSAYYAPRRRYRADRLLEHLNDRLSGEPPTTRVLGLTSVDISTTKPPHRDWGVFGLGELGGRSCVISTFRLRRRARDPRHLRFRVVTTAVHEVGHTLGLEHCTEPRCLMRDAEGSIATVDSSTGDLGPECRAELDRESPLRPGLGAIE